MAAKVIKFECISSDCILDSELLSILKGYTVFLALYILLNEFNQQSSIMFQLENDMVLISPCYRYYTSQWVLPHPQLECYLL